MGRGTKRGRNCLNARKSCGFWTRLAGKEVPTGRTDEETGKPETVKLPANPIRRAMALLGINCGFGNTFGGFDSSTPFMPIHVGDEIARPWFVPFDEENNFFRVTAVRHRIQVVDASEITHLVEVCIEPLPGKRG